VRLEDIVSSASGDEDAGATFGVSTSCTRSTSLSGEGFRAFASSIADSDAVRTASLAA